MAADPDVIVIGGGIAGASVAYHLVTAGVTTTLIDRHHDGRATDAGAGILSPETSGNPLDRWFELVTACGRYYPELVAALDAAGTPGTGYDRCGLLAVALADWDVSSYNAVADLALERAQRSGADIHPIDPDEAARRHPVAAPITRALFNPDAARVDGRRITEALLHLAVERGLTTEAGTVDAVDTAKGRVTAVAVEGDRRRCGAVVIAGGAWSPVLGRQLDANLKLRPERGEIVHLDTDRDDTGDWPILQPAFGFYVVSWAGGRVVVGATRDPRSGFDARPTVAGVHQVLGEIARVTPALATAPIAEIRVGLRPVSLDDLPILGPLPNRSNAHVATGYGANGLLLSPWCGQLVAAGLVAGRPSDDLAPFLPERFS